MKTTKLKKLVVKSSSSTELNMRTYLEKIFTHPENPELSVIFKAMEDDIDPSTLGDAHPYMEESVADEIQLKFYSGNKAAWFTADVVVCKKGDEENLQYPHGNDSLAGCNYQSFEDFLKSEQFTDMVKVATEDMTNNQGTVASSPSWHSLTEHAIVFGTEEQFKQAQEFDSEYNEEATFLPCIIEDKGYSPHDVYPDFETEQYDDGSYEEMVENGEIDSEEVDKDTFLMDCLKSALEETWKPDLAPIEKETEASTKPEFLEFLDKELQSDKVYNAVWDEYAEDLSVMTEPNPRDELNYEMWEEASLKHKVFDYVEERPTNLGKFKDGTNDLPYALFLLTNGGSDKDIVEEITSDVIRASLTTATNVSWEEVSPNVWVYGDIKQVECAIQEGDLPCELPCIVDDKGYEPLSETPDYTLNDFLEAFESDQSANQSKLAQMRQALEKSYNPEAYSNYVLVEEEEIKDFESQGNVVGDSEAGKSKASSSRVLTNMFEGIEVGDRIFDVEIEQHFSYDSDYGADADGNRGQAVWSYEDTNVLSAEEHILDEEGNDTEKTVTIKDAVTLRMIEHSKELEGAIEQYDWDLSNNY